MNSGNISHNEKLGVFTVLGTTGNPNVIRLFPKESCSCPSTRRCYHIMAVRMSIGLDIACDKKKINLTELRRNTRSRRDKTSGRKRPRLEDCDVVAAPDSLMSTSGASQPAQCKSANPLMKSSSPPLESSSPPMRSPPINSFSSPMKSSPINQSRSPMKPPPMKSSSSPMRSPPIIPSGSPMKSSPINQSRSPMKPPPMKSSSSPMRSPPINPSGSPMRSPPINQSGSPMKSSPINQLSSLMKPPPMKSSGSPMRSPPINQSGPSMRSPPMKSSGPSMGSCDLQMKTKPSEFKSGSVRHYGLQTTPNSLHDPHPPSNQQDFKDNIKCVPIKTDGACKTKKRLRKKVRLTTLLKTITNSQTALKCPIILTNCTVP